MSALIYSVNSSKNDQFKFFLSLYLGLKMSDKQKYNNLIEFLDNYLVFSNDNIIDISRRLSIIDLSHGNEINKEFFKNVLKNVNEYTIIYVLVILHSLDREFFKKVFNVSILNYKYNVVLVRHIDFNSILNNTLICKNNFMNIHYCKLNIINFLKKNTKPILSNYNLDITEISDILSEAYKQLNIGICVNKDVRFLNDLCGMLEDEENRMLI